MPYHGKFKLGKVSGRIALEEFMKILHMGYELLIIEDALNLVKCL